MPGIHDRIQDAEILWKNYRFEGAFLVALCAVAAVAKQRYSNLKGDGEKFKRLLGDSMQVKLSVEYRGTCHPIECILYKWMRCKLVHEGSLPDDIKLVIETKEWSRSVRAGGAPEYLMHLGSGWFDFIVDLIKQSPEYNNVR
jgi:hypothetical protein